MWWIVLVIFATAVVSSSRNLEHNVFAAAHDVFRFLNFCRLTADLQRSQVLTKSHLLFRSSVSAPSYCSGVVAVCNTQTTLVPMCGFRWDGATDLTCTGVNWMVSLCTCSAYHTHLSMCPIPQAFLPCIYISHMCRGKEATGGSQAASSQNKSAQRSSPACPQQSVIIHNQEQR